MASREFGQRRELGTEDQFDNGRVGEIRSVSHRHSPWQRPRIGAVNLLFDKIAVIEAISKHERFFILL
jgi:hypothetical protein